nr:hypothetical protein [Tanacetum cinerariifolium]
MLVVSSLREEYNGLKTAIKARQSPTAFSKLHALLSDHDYMLGKTCAPAQSIASSFAINYVVGSPRMRVARQAQLLELTTQLSGLRFQVSPIAPSGPQAFYGVRPSNNRNNNNNNRDNRNNSRGNNNQGRGNGHQFDWASSQNTIYGTCNRCGIGHIPSQCPNRDLSTIRTRPSANFENTRAQSSNASVNWHSDTRANSHVTPDLEAMDNSEAYYGDDALHVGNEISHNLLSVHKFCHDNDVFYEFHTSYFVVKDKSTHHSSHRPHRHKMDFRSTPCVFLGYSPSHHGYRCLDISTERLYIARHVRFNEAQFPFDITKTTSPPPSKTSPYYSSEAPYVLNETLISEMQALAGSKLEDKERKAPWSIVEELRDNPFLLALAIQVLYLVESDLAALTTEAKEKSKIRPPEILAQEQA